MSKHDRETLLRLAKLLGVAPYKRKVEVPVEVLHGIARTLQGLAQKPSSLQAGTD